MVGHARAPGTARRSRRPAARGWLAELRLVAAAALLAAAEAAGAGPPCRVDVSLRPARAVRGEQVLYELRVHRREDVREVVFEHPLAFPALRTEWLPGRARSLRTEDGGERYDLVVERRALFAFRVGRFPLAGPVLLCHTRPASAGGPEAFRLEVPEQVLEAVDPPRDGRPPNFSGVVGPLRLQTVLEPRALRLGEAARLAVIAVGSGNLFEAPELLPPSLAETPGLEVLPGPRRLATDPGERLRVRITDAADLVPLRPGRIPLPDVVLPYYDPRSARYRVARAAPGILVVEEPPPEATGPAPAPPPAEPSERLPLAAWAVLLGGLAAAGAGLLLRRCRRRSELEGLLDRADRALRAGRASEAADLLALALRRAAAARLPGARALTPPELRARADGDPALREASELLAELEAARFARTGAGDPAALAARVRAATLALGASRGR